MHDRVDVAITEVDGEYGIFERDGVPHRVRFDDEQMRMLREELAKRRDEGVHMNVADGDIESI
jgi:hypothetical protein